ncbi:hypothetical protein [Xylocopilactobacillus apicola]|uniref:DUF4367 domain-containing protein n=1 Tax=Xylocopilactobacillus apicola TaxID=2932184 RepID=A0AAU9DKX3_9LACO|nr:hypothetical protein [Xylocopilactobacillus apicola]BDR59206.1 hypothetical protein XA3_16470 [Xylocopilactobacillus apicola]
MNHKLEHESPLNSLTEQQLDEMINALDSSYSADNQNRIKRNLQQKIHSKRRRFSRPIKALIAAAILLVVLPGTALAANKIWEAVTHRDGFLTTLIVKNNNADNKHYQVKFSYLLNNWTKSKNSEEISYGDPQKVESYFSALLYRPKDETKIEIPNSKQFDQKLINGHTVYLVPKHRGNEQLFEALVLFEKEQRVVQLFFGSEVSKEEAEKIITGMSLTPAAAGQAAPEIALDQLYQQARKIPSILQANNPRIKDFKTTFTQQDSKNSTVRIEPLAVNISKTVPAKFDLSKDAAINPDKMVASDGNLTPFEGELYRRGDGKKTIDHKIKSLTIQPYFCEIKLKVTNDSTENIEKFGINPPNLKLLKSVDQQFVLDESVYSSPYQGFAEPVIALPHGSGEHDYFTNIGSLKAHESKIITYGYLVINPQDYKPFLQFDIAGRGSDDLNSPNYDWLRLPLK